MVLFRLFIDLFIYLLIMLTEAIFSVVFHILFNVFNVFDGEFICVQTYSAKVNAVRTLIQSLISRRYFVRFK